MDYRTFKSEMDLKVDLMDTAEFAAVYVALITIIFKIICCLSVRFSVFFTTTELYVQYLQGKQSLCAVL